MSEECKVLSIHRDGSTTIKKMLIDGHKYTMIMEGKKIIHKRHSADCEKCRDERVANGFSVMSSSGEEIILDPSERAQYAAFKKEWDNHSIYEAIHEGKTAYEAFKAEQAHPSSTLTIATATAKCFGKLAKALFS